MRQNFAKQVFKKWGRGVVAKKQPQVVKIPPHGHGPKALLWKILVYSKYVVGEKEEEKLTFHHVRLTPTYLS